MNFLRKKLCKVRASLKKATAVISNRLNPKITMVITSIYCCYVFNITRILAVDSNTGSIDGFIDFVCDWLKKIGGVVALVGGVMFSLGWQREDAEGKSRGLLTLMAGFMLVAISLSKGIFGL